jgi:LmbE family N-acetylglucosaminyl deacetylase
MRRSPAARPGPRALLKGLAHRTLFPAAETAWALGFGLAGRLLRPRARWFAPTGADRVLVIAPHPDDETLGCGGTLALHARAGDSVCVLIVTDGGSSRAGGLERERMRALRRSEAQRAISALARAELVQLDLPEGRWSPEDLLPSLRTLLERTRPTLVYATSCVDFHPEHLKVAQVAARALTSFGGGSDRRVRVRVYELQVPLTPFLANVAVDVSAASGLKARALAEYRTQAGAFAWVPRHARYLRSLYRSAAALEVFWEMPAVGYGRHMSGYPGISPRFRSVRLRPFSDPLAWMVGLRSRARLRELAAGRDG